MTHRQLFENALAADRYDIGTRLVFADWLDENGFDDEATEQRRMATDEWCEADQWMHWFANECGMTGYNDEDEIEITYQMVIDAGTGMVKNGDYFSQIGSDTARNAYDNNEEKFWECWSIITGVSLKETPSNPFSCSC